MKKALAVIVAAGAVLSLAACTGGGSPQASGAGGKTEITILAYQGEGTMGPVIDAFNAEHPDINLTVAYNEGTDGGAYANTLQTRIAGNQTPDIFQIVTENRTDVINNGIALDLSDAPVVKTVAPSYLDLYRNGDKVYGVTFTAWMGGLIYNKDILAKAGYTDFPDTWDGFVKLGQALKAKGVKPYLEDQSFASGSLTALLASSFGARGVDSSKWVLDGKPDGETYEQAWTPVLNEWKTAIDAGVLSKDTVGLGGDQIKSAFISGDVAMFRSGNWDANDLRTAGVNFGFAPFPAYPDGKTYINGGGDPAYAVSAKSTPEKQAAAKTFLEWLGSKEGVELLCKGGGAMSISQNYSSDPGQEFASAYENNLKKGQFYWIEWSKGSNPMTATMSGQQQLLIQGQATPESFAKAMDAQRAKL